MKKLTKNQKQELKRKIFKISAILSFILNGLFILFLIVGLCGSSANKESSNQSIKNQSNITYKMPVLNSPTFNSEGFDFENFKPYYYNRSYEINGKNISMIFYQFLNYTTFGRSPKYFEPFDFRASGYFTYNSRTYMINGHCWMWCDGTNFFFGSDGSTPFDLTIPWNSANLSLYLQSTTEFTVTNNLVNYCTYFYYCFGGNYNNNQITNKEYFLKPFFELDYFDIGVYYPINWEKSDLETNNHYYSMFYIDYDNSVYLYDLKNNSFFKIGSRFLDSKNTPFFKSLAKAVPIFGAKFDNFYRFDYLTSIKYDNFFSRISEPVITNINNEKYVHLKGSYFFQWGEFGAWTVLNQASTSRQDVNQYIDVNYTIDSISDTNFNKILFQYSTTTHIGAIHFYDSSNDYYFYKWESFDIANTQSYYRGAEYGINLPFPYDITLNFDGYISQEDFRFLAQCLVPINVKLVDVDIYHLNQGALTNVFSLLTNGFESLNHILNIEIFGGITILGLMLIPLFVYLIVAIIKLIKG